MNLRLSYASRATQCVNKVTKNLFLLIENKRSNLALSADVTDANVLLDLADKVGPEICVLKTHIDILINFNDSVTKKLQSIAKKHEFLIFEDRKFADIGNTVKQQYEGGIYQIADWADIVNAHSIPGESIISGLAEVGRAKNRGLLLLAEMSSENNLFSRDYIHKTLIMAAKHRDFVMGFISQHKLSMDPQWIYMTPGVQLNVGNDALGQQYITPNQAIFKNGSDVIIVGRGIISAPDPVEEAKKYRDAGWEAYKDSLLETRRFAH